MTHYPKSHITTLRYDFLLDNNTLITNNRLAKNSHRKGKKKKLKSYTLECECQQMNEQINKSN